MSLKSMTGYGRACGVYNGIEINIDIRSVNHRYFDFNSKVGKDYIFLEDKIKTEVNKSVSRGKIDFYLFVDTKNESTYEAQINEPLALGYLDAFRQLSRKLKIKNDLTSSYFTRVPDVVTLKKNEINEDEVSKAVMSALSDALSSYDSMRKAEGEKLGRSIVKNLDSVLANVAQIEKLAPQSIEAYRERLKSKIQEVLDGRDVDEQRLITEVAIFADKIDVGEETVRLDSHICQFKSLLESDGDPVGKKLDFIIQEMNREINTIGSKCNSIEITRLVVDTKSVIEKIREQIQNIE